MPESRAVPFPFTKLTPLGSVAPPSLSDGAGYPVVVTVKVPVWPVVKVVIAALAMSGASRTVSVNDWL